MAFKDELIAEYHKKLDSGEFEKLEQMILQNEKKNAEIVINRLIILIKEALRREMQENRIKEAKECVFYFFETSKKYFSYGFSICGGKTTSFEIIISGSKFRVSTSTMQSSQYFINSLFSRLISEDFKCFFSGYYSDSKIQIISSVDFYEESTSVAGGYMDCRLYI